MPSGEISSPQPETFATPEQANTLYNLARSFRNMNGSQGFSARYEGQLTEPLPDAVFAEAGELHPGPDPIYGLELSVMNDAEREAVIPHLIETEGADQAASARIWFVRGEPGTAEPGTPVQYETCVTYKILETPTDDPALPTRQLVKSTTETDVVQRDREQQEKRAAAEVIELGGESMKIIPGTAQDRNEIFTVVPAAEAQAVIDYLTDEAVRQSNANVTTVPPDWS